MRIKRVEALAIKPGPTQSGPTQPPPTTPHPVGGEVVPVFGGEVMMLIMVAILVFFGFILYKKGNVFLRLLTKLGF